MRSFANIRAGASAPAPHHEPRPWSLPLVTELTATTLKSWNDLLQRVPGAWEAGVGGAFPFLGAHNDLSQVSLSPIATLSHGNKRGAQAMFQRIFHHDLLDTVLLHGQTRVEELLNVGEKILRVGAQILNVRTNDFREGVTLSNGRVACIRPETLEPMAHSLRHLFLRTQLWAREFPFEPYRLKDGPASTKDIERAASNGLNREYSRLFDVAVSLAAQPPKVQGRLLDLSPAHPCKPYTEAISAEFERDFKSTEFDAWKLRRQLEPGGENHRNAHTSNVKQLSLADQVFIHRLVRFRLDALRRSGPDGFGAQLAFGEKLRASAPQTLTPAQLFDGRLKGLPGKGQDVRMQEPLLERLAHADHTGWLSALEFVDKLGIHELRQPRRGERGDDADRPYEELPDSVRNRVKLNVLSRATTLGGQKNEGAAREIERNLVLG